MKEVYLSVNIMTWNTGITENLFDCDKCNKILDYVDEFLKKEDAIVFLQQIVYKDPQMNWAKHEICNVLLDKFQKYTVKFYSRSSFMMTVAIASGEGFRELDDSFLPVGRPKNRSIAVKFHNLTFLGIHAENGKDNGPFLKSIPDKADVILGDFNAGNYLESDNRKIFNSILNRYVCICNMPTKITESGRRTCIDHIFVKKDIITRCSNLIVHEEIKLSDHYPITFEICNKTNDV